MERQPTAVGLQLPTVGLLLTPELEGSPEKKEDLVCLGTTLT